MLRDKFNLGAVKQITYAQEEISGEGMKELETFIRETFRDSEDWPIYFPVDTFDRSWVVVRGEYAGTLPKRISSWLFKVHGVRMTAAQLSTIGNIAKKHCIASDTYYLDFTACFDWRAGDFGDSGSCYWGCHEYARTMLADHDSLAVRLYKDSEGENGYARAWIVFPKKNELRYAERRADKPDLAVIYNAYGIDLIRLTRLVATHLNLSYSKVELRNQGTDSGTLWINGGTGYALGLPQAIDGLERVNLDWESNEYSCANCGDTIGEDEGYGPDGDLCESCCDEIYTRCERCGEYTRNEDTISVDGETWCDSCFDRHGFICEDCEENYHVRYSNTVELYDGGERTVCDNCLDQKYTRCADCDKYAPDDDILEDKCPDCARAAMKEDDALQILVNDAERRAELQQAYANPNQMPLWDKFLNWAGALIDMPSEGYANG